MCKMWSNKNNTRQLKIPTKQLKANSAIASQTKLNAYYLIPVTKHSHLSHQSDPPVSPIRLHHTTTTKAKKRVDKEDEISPKGINKSNHIYIYIY